MDHSMAVGAYEREIGQPRPGVRFHLGERRRVMTLDETVAADAIGHCEIKLAYRAGERAIRREGLTLLSRD